MSIFAQLALRARGLITRMCETNGETSNIPHDVGQHLFAFPVDKKYCIQLVSLKNPGKTTVPSVFLRSPRERRYYVKLVLFYFLSPNLS